MADDRTRILEGVLARVARAAYADGSLEDAGRERIKRLVRALDLDTARARDVLRAARTPGGGATDEELWIDVAALLRTLPAGSGRRVLAARAGEALGVDARRITALVREMADAAPEIDPSKIIEQLRAGPVDGALLDRAAEALARDDDPACGPRLVELVDLAGRHAKSGDSPERWERAAGLARGAVRFLAGIRDWKSVRAIDRWLGAVPRPFEQAVAPGAAGALAAWGTAALAARAPDELARARDRLARLAMRQDLAPVRREYAALLAELIANVVRDTFPDAAEGLLCAGLLESLAQAHWEDRELVLSFAGACPDLELMLVTARDDVAHRKLLARLAELAGRHARDEDIAHHLARGVVHVAVLRSGELAPARRTQDPLLAALRATLDAILEANPGSDRLTELSDRFDRQPGVPPSRLLASPVSRPAGARARHPDVLELRDAFERLQLGNNQAMSTMARILGVGPYLGRLIKEGEEAYAKDELYFLDILEEIERQVQHDRSGYWRIQLPKLETMTRYMLEDATPAIAAAARALRDRLKFKT